MSNLKEQRARERANQRAATRILNEVGRGTLGIRWEALRMMMLANRAYKRRMPGPGVFHQIREFEPGEDEFRFVDPLRTLQTGDEDKFMVRDYQPEVKERWQILFDASPTNDFAGLRQSKLDVCARAAATAVICAQIMDDDVGFIAYSGNDIVCHIQSMQPRNILRRVVETVLDPPFLEEGEPDEGLEKAYNLMPKDGTLNVIWLSDCLNVKNKGLRVVSKMSRLLGSRKLVVPWDERERVLPAASAATLWLAPRIPVFDMRDKTRHYLLCTASAREQYTQEWDEHMGIIRRKAKRRRMQVVFVQTEHSDPRMEYKNPRHQERVLLRQRRDAIQKILRLYSL